MGNEPAPGTHRLLVEALGDPTALAELGDAQWLPNEAWRRALERVRQERFGHLPPNEGLRAVGAALGEGYLKSDVGRVIAETLPVLSGGRFFELLVPALGQRLRSAFDVQWVPREGGGTLAVRGDLAAAPELTLGFFEVAVRRLAQPVRLSIASSEPGALRLEADFG